MSAAKHTPGPWFARPEDDSSGRFEVKDESGAWVARVHFRNGPDDGEGASNAALIAAAPGMLEALRHVERLLLHGENPGENGEGYAAHLDAVRAAIAKAEGSR